MSNFSKKLNLLVKVALKTSDNVANEHFVPLMASVG